MLVLLFNIIALLEEVWTDNQTFVIVTCTWQLDQFNQTILHMYMYFTCTCNLDSDSDSSLSSSSRGDLVGFLSTVGREGLGSDEIDYLIIYCQKLE